MFQHLHIGLAALGAALAVGMIGGRAADVVGRNPGSSTKVLVQSILAIAFAEAIVFYTLFLVRQDRLMNALALMAQAESSGQIEQIARTFGVDWPHLIAQMISFAIVCALLYRFAYRPVLGMLAQRRELIAKGLANTEKINAELARTEAQRQEVLAHANAQGAEFIQEARSAAARLAEQ